MPKPQINATTPEGMVWCEPILRGKAKWVPKEECSSCHKRGSKTCPHKGGDKMKAKTRQE